MCNVLLVFHAQLSTLPTELTPHFKGRYIVDVIYICFFFFTKSRQNDILLNSVDPLVGGSIAALIFECFTLGWTTIFNYQRVYASIS